MITSQTFILNYLFTPFRRVLIEKLTSSHLVKKFPTLYGTWRFITALKSSRQLCLSWASSIQSIIPHPTTRTSFYIILPSTSGFPYWSASLRFPHQNPVHASPLLHTRYIYRPSHSSRFNHQHNIGWGAQIQYIHTEVQTMTVSL
jgi:hypothetical protein